MQVLGRFGSAVFLRLCGTVWRAFRLLPKQGGVAIAASGANQFVAGGVLPVGTGELHALFGHEGGEQLVHGLVDIKKLR